MNILIVSQNFIRGGLETQIFTQYNIMKNKHKFYFAFGKYNSNLNFDECKIYRDFNFDVESSIEQFCLDVDRLVNIIKEEKIDIIHVHPFYSVFPAVFAAKITNIPIIYTFHGYASFNFPYKVNDVILFQSMLESEIDKVFSVSEIGMTAINNATFSSKTVFLPNSIDLNKYKKHEVINNKTWAVISRIDSDKINEIKKLISIMDKIDIKKICVYGEGDKKEELQDFTKSYNVQDKVVLMGHYDNLYEELDEKYNGIIGIGRVIMESLTMGYPTMLIGYGKIAGIIDLNMYNTIKKCNFVNRMFQDINIDELNSQIENVYKQNDERNEIYNSIRREYSANTIYEKYEKEINLVKISDVYNIQKIYTEIKKIENIKENIYDSRLVYNILKKYIEPECLSINLKSYFINFNNYFNIIDSNYKEQINLKHTFRNIEDSISNIKNNIDSINNTINNVDEATKDAINIINCNVSNINEQIGDIKKEQISLEDKINLKYLTYNTFNKTKNKFKK